MPSCSIMAQGEAAWTSIQHQAFREKDPHISSNHLISPKFPREGGRPGLPLTSPDITVPDDRRARGCLAHLIRGLTALTSRFPVPAT